MIRRPPRSTLFPYATLFRSTHPELLDWLAVQFVRNGWSLKKLHRLILTSTAWRQRSRVRPEAAAVDPENRLLWRMPLERMDAEIIRDSMLAATHQLNTKMYGPAVGVKQQPDGQVVAGDTSDSRRRSIYLLHRRSTPLTILETFDAPRMTTNCIQRQTSNVVSQALLMLNSQFSEGQAIQLAEQVTRYSNKSRPKQIEALYRVVLGRDPTESERDIALGFLKKQASGYGPSQQIEASPDITSVIGMHASKGITFDLQAFRKARPGNIISKFTAVAALGHFPNGAGDAHFYLFLDGKREASGRLKNNTSQRIELPISPNSRFLTLITSSNGTLNTDWVYFGNPRLTLTGNDGSLESFDLADVVGGGDGNGKGRQQGIDPWSGNTATAHTKSTDGTANIFHAVDGNALVDGVFVPDGGPYGSNEVPITSTGIRVSGISDSPARTYDHIWNGHNSGVNGLKRRNFAERDGALVDLCLVLLNSAGFLYID